MLFGTECSDNCGAKFFVYKNFLETLLGQVG
jgi:hypothetical protein